jgi:hypothetical protein
VSKKKKNELDEAIAGLIGLVIVAGMIVAFLFSAAVMLPILAVCSVLFGGVYFYYRSPGYLEKKAREHTLALYHEACAKYRAESPADLAAKIVEAVPATPIAPRIGVAAYEILVAEGIAGIPEPPLVCNSLEGARYRDKLSRMTEFPSPDRAREVLVKAFTEFIYSLPSLSEDGPFSIPLIELVESPGTAIEALVLPLYDEDGLFVSLKRRLDHNAVQASGGKRMLLPTEYKGDNIAYTYLKDTPLLPLLELRVPLQIPFELFYQHAVVTGGSGHGKTQLLQNLVLSHLERSDPPSLVVVDSQGEMLEKIARLELFDPLAGRLRERLIVLDPRDAPALNIFDINQARLQGYGAAEREQVLNYTLETFSYLFNSLLGADLTTKQSVLFTNLVALMLELPKALGRNATLLDLLHIMQDPAPYRPAIDALDPVAREFFLTDFMPSRSDPYRQTKEQVRYRLQAILGNSTLSRLFLAPRNRIDFFERLNEGAILLVDTNKGLLGAKNSSYMGRIAITLVLQALLERAAMPAGSYKTPTFLIIDEAGEYFDKSIDAILTEARKQNAGLLMAHQYFGQMTPELRASVASNTSIKFAGGLSAADARAAALDMRTTPEFILAQEPLSFACYLRGVTPKAVSLKVAYGLLEDHARMSEAAYRALRQRNRERVTCALPEEEKKPPLSSAEAAASSPPPQEADPTAPQEWV